MKHAGPAALARLEPLLRVLRKKPALKEKSRGVFYRRGRAFLHFHEHGEELHADMRLADDFERFAATSQTQQALLLKKIDAALRTP